MAEIDPIHTQGVDEINNRNAESKARNLDWAIKEGYDVDEKGNIFDPETKNQVVLLTRLDSNGNDLTNEAPHVYPFPTGDVPDLSLPGSDAGVW